MNPFVYPFLWKTKISLQGKSFPLQHQQFFKIKFLSFQTLTELCICKHSLHTKDVLSYYRNLHVSFLYTCTIYHKHPNVFVNIMCLSYCLLILKSVIYTLCFATCFLTFQIRVVALLMTIDAFCTLHITL